MFPMQVILAHSLDAHVVMYDYSGYGESGGVPEEAYTYQDIEAVYQYVLEHVAEGGRPENVVLYGQSVGSGPCCWLAAKDDQVGGMILHSPFTSGMRVLTPSRYVFNLF
jgi:abhydrolase domain-containing protein 17